MHLRVVTPEGEKVEAHVTMVTAPGSLGELGILPGHRPLLTSLGIGKFSYVEGGKTGYLATNTGYMEVHADQITVVTESAEGPDEINVKRAKKSLSRADKLIAETDPRTHLEAYNMAMERKKRARNRLKLVEQHATPEALRVIQKKSAG